ncbi:uncharacterized protein BXZ73DRAFT_38997 [Epithele typhae]|uniref:uncharacterized protein n=1 Tax=Epithele typhae TaxID=378194 RepID=UPI002007AE13|nr:uncharacterized protein BXZ73DRAFT_38997 [Epithele typhae]KAH9945310.1 hypothetical protein BXZ73DRAFT_38997 [Epithele typhae]
MGSTSSDGSTSTQKPTKQLNLPLNLGPFSHRLRNSFADMRTSSALHASTFGPSRLPITPVDATATAAAIRLAAARVSVAPLALPSPEHELTDPMRGVTTAIPGSHPDVFAQQNLPLMSPNAVRKSRLSSFWQGTQDVEDASASPDPAAADTDSLEAAESDDGETRDVPQPLPPAGHRLRAIKVGSPLLAERPPVPAPATAPVISASPEQADEDYFGSIAHFDVSPLVADTLSSASTSGTVMVRPGTDISRQVSAPPFDNDPQTVPALPRRICLTRQTSAPLPTQSLYERRLRASRPASESAVNNLAGRAAKEEQMFLELGYLAPPNPPNELERRRALYQYNIWGTGRDPNFDRIAHLVKLVFNTRIVIITLIDGNEQFLKFESGLGVSNMARTSSLCAHAILQRDGEPTVILDAQDDWRFSRNPLVLGHAHVRFYAGCPLRTSDGYNIGTLAIMDDTPRREFSPRQRHTFKEFAQVAMREMELWKDKIQLRVRDRIQISMEQFTRECLEVDRELKDEKPGGANRSPSSASMEHIYLQAAKLVKRTLDVEGAIVVDVSHIDVLETVGSESAVSTTIHDADVSDSPTQSRSLGKDEHRKLAEFFEKFPEGKVCEGIVHSGLRPFLPARLQYALAVPIYNIDKRPFALLCAYSTGERTTPFLEGHELSYLRAIGVIILSAVLKRRMVLADKAKGLFISNISHELRTPLHGILASAELLSETSLDHSQASFLQTVQACGTSLVETVNHVLDFTKLSGNSKAGGVENVINLTKVNLMQLIEEATEGCWIGHRARMFTSEIGSVYSPPKQDRQPVAVVTPHKHVETVIDIGHSEAGWTVRCEKGGIRRVLMNLFGNSLKFTSDGFVHVMLRQLPHSTDTPSGKVRIELAVLDTGKGISQNFLKNQLFHPFTQENPLQTGTGLGLAIVNSIVRSPSVDGKVDVWSAEGVGTDIKITFEAEVLEGANEISCATEMGKILEHSPRPTVSLLAFDTSARGVELLRNVLVQYIVTDWHIPLAPDNASGDIAIINEDPSPVTDAIERKDASRPFIILSSARGDPRLMSIVNEYEHIGGFCRIVYKPVGPCRLVAALKLSLHALNISRGPRAVPPTLLASASVVRPDSPSRSTSYDLPEASSLARRYSEESSGSGWSMSLEGRPPRRPALGPRAVTAHPLTSWEHMPATVQEERGRSEVTSPEPAAPTSPTIAVGTGGTLLRSSVGTVERAGPLRVLVVEDNSILRSLLVRWLGNMGYEYREAVDGQEGVRTFETEGYFDVVLLDLSMPILDGVGATAQIRQIESRRKNENGTRTHPARILALTGMSSLEDKRRAFEAGVDGYLVKPVAFKTLDSMFQQLGVS